jgi:hypothetical protein
MIKLSVLTYNDAYHDAVKFISTKLSPIAVELTGNYVSENHAFISVLKDDLVKQNFLAAKIFCHKSSNRWNLNTPH